MNLPLGPIPVLTSWPGSGVEISSLNCLKSILESSNLNHFQQVRVGPDQSGCFEEQEVEFGAKNEVTYKWTAFHFFCCCKSKMDVSVSIVSPWPHNTAHYMIVCTWWHKNSIRTGSGGCHIGLQTQSYWGWGYWGFTCEINPFRLTFQINATQHLTIHQLSLKAAGLVCTCSLPISVQPKHKTKPNSHMKSRPDPRELFGTAVYHHMDRLIGNTDHQGNTNLNLEKNVFRVYFFFPPEIFCIHF